MTAPIVFNMVNVNGIESLGGVFIGDTSANGWEVNEKLNQSMGMNFAAFGGSTPMGGNINLISDPDAIDHPLSQLDNNPASTI
ncbi:hypothetical protein [Litchfieldia salsa]|uniref:Uncharacterized protein n=1 Tax=Litchfieldia salsa TaxID=930152 RepID=A0A1H0PJD6_9BACI|nr:hypothetical protein [Litchfieldia salsa]SDP05232.1 hypothetical protein SAMN05216565_101347 [Litchfieldia salsa]